MQPFGPAVCAARRERDLTVAELAELCGLSTERLVDIELGTTPLSSSDLTAIAPALGRSPLALVEPDSFVASIGAAEPYDPSRAQITWRLVQIAELHQVLTNHGVTNDERPSPIPPRFVTGTSTAASTARAQWLTSKLGNTRSPNRLDELIDRAEAALGIDCVVDTWDDPAVAAAIPAREFPVIAVNANQPPAEALEAFAWMLGVVTTSPSNEMIVAHRSDVTAPSPNSTTMRSLLLPAAVTRTIAAAHTGSAAKVAALIDRFGVTADTAAIRLAELELAAPAASRIRGRVDGRDTTVVERTSARWFTARLESGSRSGFVSARPLALYTGRTVDEVLDNSPAS